MAGRLITDDARLRCSRQSSGTDAIALCIAIILAREGTSAKARNSTLSAFARRGKPAFCGPLAGKGGRVQLDFEHDFRTAAAGVSLGGFWRIGMAINMTRRAALLGLSTCVALPARAQT